MFGFLKKRKAINDARNVIGVELHRQIKEALSQNEAMATQKLSTVFTPGYVYWFVRMGFSSQGIDGGQVIDKQLPIVCDGVIPGKLNDIVQRQLAALDVAQSMEDQTKPICGTSMSPSQLTELFELGLKAGSYDATCLSSHPINFKKYLLGQQLQVPAEWAEG